MTLSDKRYQSYVKAYQKKQAELAQYGAVISEPMFQKWEYDLLYPSLSNAYKSSKNIPKIAVERQAREYTTLQAQTRIKAMKQQGLISGRVKLSEYRYKEGRNAQFAQLLSEEYNRLKTEQKLSPKQARELLGVEFFGSDDDEI